MQIHRITPVLVVESVEQCLPFWTDRLGFEKTAEVPHEGRLGFVILTAGRTEVMLQSIASVRDDFAGNDEGPHRASLFIEVDDLPALQRALGDWPRLVDQRDTFYGTRETIVRDPAGNDLVFAQKLA
ncbi:VOC family protein [Nannocystis bainbridge]|uniref:VOC family protein n=1 Tax=Nannocystis bainbridge TaxID=2995303 RepID=A0ABT5E9D9_9BACT|nr:VOC family protein [Nannocystis bainbridge]MDC0721959.1 VOC family protein [Nannocystis bainbridge]